MPVTFPIHQKYGTLEGVSLADAGMYCDYGPTQVSEWDITLTELTELETIQNDVCIVPDNCLLERVDVVTLVPAVTGIAIDVGLIHISRNLTDPEFTADPDGVLAAFPIAQMNVVGEQVVFTGPANPLPSTAVGTGALVGTVIVAPTLLTVSRTTPTAFTAGRVLIRLHTRPAALSA